MNYNEYHPDWKDVIRPSILKRDNYACRVCGVINKSKVYKLSSGSYHVCDNFTFEWAKANNKKPFILYLVVAHLDQNKANNEPSNLLTLCPYHHSKYDSKSKSLLRKMKFSPGQIKQEFALSIEVQEDISHLKAIQTLVKEFTGVRIQITESEFIYQLTLKFLQNVKN